MARVLGDQRVFSELSVNCPIPNKSKHIQKYSKDSALISRIKGPMITPQDNLAHDSNNVNGTRER